MVILRLDSEVFEDGVGPKAFHVILNHVNVYPRGFLGIAYPVLYLTVSNWIV